MIDTERRLLLSVKPRFAESILSGAKTIELRRTRPRLELPTEALLYASSPTMALVGSCRVDAVVAMSPTALWNKWGGSAGVTRSEFRAYFEGAALGYGLLLSNTERLPSPIGLDSLRQFWPGFQPPQSFGYVPFDVSEQLLSIA